jgi:hypothetical protein
MPVQWEYHATTIQIRCECHANTMFIPCECNINSMLIPCLSYDNTMRMQYKCYANTMLIPCYYMRMLSLLYFLALYDRRFFKHVPAFQFPQIVQRLLTKEPKVAMEYSAMADSLVVAFMWPPPHRRMERSVKGLQLCYTTGYIMRYTLYNMHLYYL